jgi:hypothetical protein
MKSRKWIVGILSFLLLQTSFAQDLLPPSPILVIGASYSEGKPPFNNGVAPRGGGAVGFGSYLSLGQALTRHPRLPGYIINEAQAGATTFTRLFCAPGAPTCGPAGWDGYQTQLERALTRVALVPTPLYNATYVVITVPNDCIHSGAAGVPQAQSVPCTLVQLNEVVDRLIAVGQFAITKGLIPVYDVYPRYESLNLLLFQQAGSLPWVISEMDYRLLRQLSMQRLQAELPAALVLNMWRDFVHWGDGIHPNYQTAERAADIVARRLLNID